MSTLISILRGINVSGSKIIKMAELQKLFEQLGFENVTTYIQSGNVVFQGREKDTPEKISDTIEKAIRKKFGFDVPVITIPAGEMKRVVAENPLVKKKGIDETKLHVTFLSTLPAKDKVDFLLSQDFSPEEFFLKGKAIYLSCPNGYGNAKLNNNFLESKLKVKATTRNWKTVNVLAELSATLNSRKK